MIGVKLYHDCPLKRHKWSVAIARNDVQYTIWHHQFTIEVSIATLVAMLLRAVGVRSNYGETMKSRDFARFKLLPERTVFVIYWHAAKHGH